MSPRQSRQKRRYRPQYMSVTLLWQLSTVQSQQACTADTQECTALYTVVSEA